ncbi:MAG: hypothetical protein D6689_05040 [Deltaproteobacteria bacterium]|nr:MAG: hypothetical protein D6689_05040 [Deltaproteobacteria bacterium]
MTDSADTSDPTPSPAPEPGAPFPKGKLDPELVALRRPAVRVGPVLSACVVVFCIYMMASLRADLRFSREPGEPRAVADAAALLADADALVDRFVAARTVPDRSFAAMVATGAAIGGHRVTPVLGTGDRLWLWADGNPWTAEPAHDEVYRGRLRRAAALPFFPALRAYVANQPPWPRAVAIDAFRAALVARAAAVANPAGGELAVTDATEVDITERVRGRAEVVARLTPERGDEAAWGRALEAAGVIPGGATPVRRDEFALWYRVPAPGGLEPLRRALAEHDLFAAEVRPVVDRITARWGELRGGPGGVALGDHEIAWEDVDGVAIAVPHAVPDDAMVLLTDERPSAYWYLTALYVLMAAFAALFAWTLVRGVLDIARARRSPPMEPTP